MKKDKLDQFRLVEINPRLGGGTIFTTLAGANFPKMILDLAEGKKINPPKISEITVFRYFEEIVLDERNKINYSGKDLLTTMHVEYMIEEIVLDERNKINYSGKDLLTSYACHT